MNSKKPRLFLWISLSFVALSFVALLVKIALLYCEFKATSSTLSPNDLIHFEYVFFLSCLHTYCLEYPLCSWSFAAFGVFIGF